MGGPKALPILVALNRWVLTEISVIVADVCNPSLQHVQAKLIKSQMMFETDNSQLFAAHSSRKFRRREKAI
ncbi:hypothetical protein M378DRAFT_160772 [Amanita muscaria Koide BX008]|uniref:Uncharacterized protein n=1 Tax=Amanita muscaria (strain Koide BX008) TaxID=946122 RepID=A0A0C2WX26_AMAMK|nr:hypothetical protein M378DRAFT_160772 [Amanita muscaria Koide BX008]